jgi:hypothetical protein
MYRSVLSFMEDARALNAAERQIQKWRRERKIVFLEAIAAHGIG